MSQIIILIILINNALGPACNEFGYNKHPATTSSFLYTKIIDSSVKKFSYNEHPLTMNSFFSSFY